MIGYLDCSTGASGDKLLGALLDAGAATGAFSADHVATALSSLAPEARVVAERVRSHGIAAMSVRVEAAEDPPARSWADIRSMIEAAEMPERARAGALRTFELLAGAEARAHDRSADDIHFHEVGALDSILDVVGVWLGLEALGIEKLLSTPVATGWGTVDTSHGVLPIPAPATAALLTGVPTAPGPARPDGTTPGELTTPTGIALLQAAETRYGVCPPLTIEAAGYGAGTRDIGNPNVCRIVIGRSGDDVSLESQTVALLETNIDHISAEAGAFAAEQLLAEGALDVWTAPVFMKKGRAGFVLSALVESARAEHFSARIVALTGTLGVRTTEIGRFVAEREIATVATAYGPVRYKIGAAGATPQVRPEHNDVARIARETSRQYRDVAEELTALYDE